MNAGTSVLILGGGFGGVATARTLRRLLPREHTIQLVSRDRTFQVGATKTWIMLGETQPEKVQRPLDALRRFGIDVLFADVLAIDATRRSVRIDGGELRADYLVVALGATLEMSAVPGLAEAAETFYTREGAVRLRETLQRFRGGRIVLLIPRVPFQCPPGPYEGAMLLHSWLERRGLRAKTEIEIHTIEKAPMPTAGPAIGKYIVERLAERGIGFHPQREVRSVDAARKTISMAEGGDVSYDLLLAIPPHQAPPAVRDSGLTNAAGWIPVDATTLEVTAAPVPHRVYAVGDVTSVPLPGRYAADVPLVLPKAGIFAEAQGVAAAKQIESHVLHERTSHVFDGKGFCYIELGGGVALRGDGSFFDLPHPTMVPSEADPAQLEEKRKWIEGWTRDYLEQP